MCWIAIPLTPSKYSVKCVLSFDLQSRFRNEFTSVLLGNVIEHIQKCVRISIAMGRRNHLPRKCMAPVTTAHILPSSIQRHTQLCCTLQLCKAQLVVILNRVVVLSTSHLSADRSVTHHFVVLFIRGHFSTLLILVRTHSSILEVFFL